jgi:hypothetical protein
VATVVTVSKAVVATDKEDTNKAEATNKAVVIRDKVVIKVSRIFGNRLTVKHLRSFIFSGRGGQGGGYRQQYQQQGDGGQGQW